jgi:hypothetical protein
MSFTKLVERERERYHESSQPHRFIIVIMAPIASTLALGAGCYWGTEKYIVKDFQKKHPGCIASAKGGAFGCGRWVGEMMCLAFWYGSLIEIALFCMTPRTQSVS